MAAEAFLCYTVEKFMHRGGKTGNSMKILFLGDVIGEAGCRVLQKALPDLKRKYKADVCIVNGENSANGKGLRKQEYEKRKSRIKNKNA